MSDRMFNVLFLGATNSTRTTMAEGILRKDGVRAVSMPFPLAGRRRIAT